MKHIKLIVIDFCIITQIFSLSFNLTNYVLCHKPDGKMNLEYSKDGHCCETSFNPHNSAKRKSDIAFSDINIKSSHSQNCNDFPVSINNIILNNAKSKIILFNQNLFACVKYKIFEPAIYKVYPACVKRVSHNLLESLQSIILLI